MDIAHIREWLTAEPAALLVVLCGVAASVFLLAENRRLGRIFRTLPTVFWIYFVPMLLATLGFLPGESPAYALLADLFLPASLLLLMLSVRLPEIARLGRPALGLMTVGAIGIVLGAAIGTLALLPFFRLGVLPEAHLASFWKGVAALSASWTGGSSNMAAVWETLVGASPTQAEGQILAAMIAVDVCVGYSWMAFLIMLAGWQRGIDGWLRADAGRIEAVGRRVASVAGASARPATTREILCMLALAFAVALVCRWIGGAAQSALEARVESPLWRSVLGGYGLMIVLVTLCGLALSLTPVARLEEAGASKIGYALLYLVLAGIGARGDLRAVRDFPAYLVMGVVWMAVHGGLLVLAARASRIPVFFVGTASQACVGGTVSAPIVAEAYRPGLAAVGLLMAVLGNCLGTFLGLFAVAPMIHWLGGLFR